MGAGAFIATIPPEMQFLIKKQTAKEA